MQLLNRRLVLTGGISGIGRHLAIRLARQNHVIVLARQSDRSAALLAEAPHIEFMNVDLANCAETIAAGHALAAGSPVHGLINCAAVQYTPLLSDADFSVDTIWREIAINLAAPCELTALLLPALLAADQAFVMNLNSGLGLVPKTQSAVYCATKGGLNIFTQALRNQLRGSTVRVQQAFLPLVDTPMTKGRGQGKLDAGDVARRIIAGIEGETPDLYIGKVRLLRLINRIAPPLARRIMRAG